jgi:hypothetical protein
MRAKQWKKLTFINDSVEAEMVRGLLEAQGIQVLLSKEAVGQVWGLSVGSASEVDVYVASDQFKEAQKILNTYVKNPGNDQG